MPPPRPEPSAPAKPPSASPGQKRPVDPRLALGRRVKELRATQGLTQEELADRSGLFRTYMSRIESGQANPTVTMLHQIADAFAVDVRELFVVAKGDIPVRVKSAQPSPSRGRVKR